MGLKHLKNTVLLFVLIVLTSCNNSKNKTPKTGQLSYKPANNSSNQSNIVVGANKMEAILPILQGKLIGVVANQTSVVFKNLEDSTKSDYTHLIDTLINLGIKIKTVFAPEHGFRGTADAGELIKDGVDIKTGLPIISLYGKNKKPRADQLKEVELMVFDIQDVGARFYTYISTLHYVMEACAENDIKVLVLDRPNPNGHYIDGPILEPEHKSFVGMHPVPIVHGMTIGEYAMMINGEGWLKNGIKCDLEVIPMDNYTHKLAYSLPIKPSPNLPNDKAINLYPSLCLFEGTMMSVGRGTNKQFQIVGAPFLKTSTFNYSFTPKPNKGAKFPKHKDQQCFGLDLTQSKRLAKLELDWLLSFYEMHKDSEVGTPFFTDFFTKLAGTQGLETQIKAGMSTEEIRQSWAEELLAFKEKRKQYLIYND